MGPRRPCSRAPATTSYPPEIVHVGKAVDFAMVDGGGAFGVEVDVQGQARANAQPQQVFCDMQAMMLGLTFAH
jgi:hypothetical protein